MPDQVLYNDALGAATRTFGTMAMTGLFYESFMDNITAHAGGGQSSAYLVTTEISRVTTVATVGDSIQLPVAVQGLTLFVINHGANTVQIYGNNAAGDTIDDIATGTGVGQMVGSLCFFTCTSTGKWYSNGLGTGYSGSLETSSFKDAITAHAGGTQAGAVGSAASILISSINRITVVATNGDSVALPVSAPGLSITVINAASNSLQVFGQSPDTINAVATGTGVTVAGGKTATFYCVVSGAWHMLLSS